MKSVLSQFLENEDIENEPKEGELESSEEQVIADAGLTPDEADLVEKNMGLAGYYAKKYSKSIPEVDYSDILHMATLGLAKAAKSWIAKSPATRSPFNRYASKSILNHIKYQYFTQKEYANTELKTLDAPVPGMDGENIGSAKDMVRSGETTLFTAPEVGDEESSEATDGVDKDAEDTGADMGSSEDEEAISRGGMSNAGDYKASQSGGKELARKEAFELVNKALSKLPEQEQELIKKWLSGSSYRDLQNEYPMSHMKIGNIIRQGTQTMRAELEKYGVKDISDILPESTGREYRKMLIEAIIKQKGLLQESPIDIINSFLDNRR